MGMGVVPAPSRNDEKIIFEISGPQKGPAERGHVKKRQKSSKSIKNIFDPFRHFSRRANNVKNRQKVSRSFSTLLDNFRAAPAFRPLLGGSDERSSQKGGRQGVRKEGQQGTHLEILLSA